MPFQPSAPLQLQKAVRPGSQIRACLGGGHQIHEDLAGAGRLAHEEMAEIALVAHAVIVGKAALPGKGEGSLKNRAKILVHDLTFVYVHNVVEAPPPVHA